ncbi:MAG: hypothetical protein R6X22_06755, partial [Gemmatimonadota bacterium]
MMRLALRMVAPSLVALALAACGGDEITGPDGPDGPCAVTELLPGEHSVFEGSAAVDCIGLPAAATGDEYEVLVTAMSRTLAFNPMELRITPAGQSLASVPAVSLETPRAASAGAEVDRAWRAGQYAWDLRMRRLEAPLLSAIRANAARGGAGLFAVPAVDDTLEFGFSCITAEDFPNAPSSITGVVRAVSARAVVVEDTTAVGAFTSLEYEGIAANFDDVIYDTDVQYFGAPGDIDDNGGRVVLLYAAGVNNLSEDYNEAFVAGFTCPLDLGFAGGNDAEMFYLMVPDPTGQYTQAAGDAITKDQVRRITDNTVAHEFQHMINAQSGNGGAQDVWLNEGLSHLAEEAVGHAVNGFDPGAELGPEELLATQPRVETFNKYYLNNWFNISQYLAAPEDTAALLNAEDPLDFNTFRMRGSAWLFVRYLLDRYENGTAGEAGRTVALIQSSAADSRDAITQVFGTDFDRLATDWATMLGVEDRSDVTPAAPLTLSSYRLRDVFDSQIGAVVNPPAGGYPLVPRLRGLGVASTIDANLFTGTGLYVTLRASAAGPGTELRLVAPGTGATLAASL